jgi:hypothetical protein
VSETSSMAVTGEDRREPPNLRVTLRNSRRVIVIRSGSRMVFLYTKSSFAAKIVRALLTRVKPYMLRDIIG